IPHDFRISIQGCLSAIPDGAFALGLPIPVQNRSDFTLSLSLSLSLYIEAPFLLLACKPISICSFRTIGCGHCTLNCTQYHITVCEHVLKCGCTNAKQIRNVFHVSDQSIIHDYSRSVLEKGDTQKGLFFVPHFTHR